MTDTLTRVYQDYLVSLLQDMAEVSSAILVAGAQAEVEKIGQEIDKLRHLRAQLQAVEQEAKTRLDTMPPSFQEKVNKLLFEIGKSEGFFRAWTQRFDEYTDPISALDSDDGRQAAIDKFLNNAWDWSNDIVAVALNTPAIYIKILKARGQKKIVCVNLDADKKFEKNDDVTYLEDKWKMRRLFEETGMNYPRRVLDLATFLDSLHQKEEDKESEHQKGIELLKRAWRTQITNTATINKFGSRWILQGIDNLPYIAENANISELENAFKDVPMVIISPGPSLDKNIEQLRALQGKALLVAPAQTAAALAKANIFPNIIGVADPIGEMAQYIDNFPIDKVDALLLGVSCHTGLFEENTGKIITFNGNAGVDTWISGIFNDTCRLGSGGSISTCLFHIGQFLNCNPIVLVGQDLALSDGRAYSSGGDRGEIQVKVDAQGRIQYDNVSEQGQAIYLEQKPGDFSKYREEVFMLPGYYGGEVVSKADYAVYHAEFERQAESAKEANPDIKLYNCTEGGAMIKGFENISLRELAEKISAEMSEPPNVRATLQACLANVDTTNRRELLKARLNSVKTSLQESYSLAKRCQQIAVKTNPNPKLLTSLSQLEKELITAVKNSSFISISMQNALEKAILMTSKSKTMRENLNASLALYDLISNEAPRILTRVNAALGKMK